MALFRICEKKRPRRLKLEGWELERQQTGKFSFSAPEQVLKVKGNVAKYKGISNFIPTDQRKGNKRFFLRHFVLIFFSYLSYARKVTCCRQTRLLPPFAWNNVRVCLGGKILKVIMFSLCICMGRIMVFAYFVTRFLKYLHRRKIKPHKLLNLYYITYLYYVTTELFSVFSKRKLNYYRQ